MIRPVCVHHCTSEPYRFFGRAAELGLLDAALRGGSESVVALIGPGGQGKTAIVQHWLERLLTAADRPDGVFLWSFYRGKDADLCLRSLYAYAEGLEQPPDLSASYCVDHLLPLLRRERWAIVLDGTEVAQHDGGSWMGRFLHPELGRLLEEVASEPLPGVVVLTTRFPLPTLTTRRHARLISLSGLDADSAHALLASLGVHGDTASLNEVAAAGGHHAKAVELLGTFLVRYHQGQAQRHKELPVLPRVEGASEEEHRVAQVLAAYQQALPQEMQDLLALATAFRDPPAEARLREYLASQPVHSLLHETWRRTYPPFAERPAAWLAERIQELIDLRLLERVGRAGPVSGGLDAVIDAHPLVRRAFDHALGAGGQRQSARTRAGFLRGRPDRRRPETLEEAREEVEMFHAYCDAGLWSEADSAFVALDNPKHRFLAPVLERDLLLRFFPTGDWRRPALWLGFGRFRSLAICFELLGQFEDALAAYREADAALRGDALIALGHLGPLLVQMQALPPWQTLWRAYRCHALCLAGRTEEAVALAKSLVPVDVYEWVHVFECLLRAGQLTALDVRSILFRPPHIGEHRWADLARRRMRADYTRVVGGMENIDLDSEYRELLEAYDRGGLPFERALTRLSYATWLMNRGQRDQSRSIARTALELGHKYAMRIVEADAWMLLGALAASEEQAEAAREGLLGIRGEIGAPLTNRP
jgi:tetratricopeptide (TPR) repeat protein